MTTSSVELQVPLVIVERNVIFEFVGTEVIVVVADDGVVITEVPPDPTKLQTPVAGDVGLFPASVNVDVLHNA